MGASTRALLRLTVAMAIAATSLGLGQGTAHAADAIENSYEQDGPWEVTWSEGAPGGTADHCENGQGDPDGAFTYVYPTHLGAFGGPHPVIVWGNGTSLTGDDGTCAYDPVLRYLASWGYVVVAANSSSVGNGDLLRWGGVDVANRNNNPSDPFYQKIDTSSIGVAGHSQGAVGAVNAALDMPGFFASVTSFSIPSRAWMEFFINFIDDGNMELDDLPSKAAMDGLDVPVFFLWGTEDSFAIWPTLLVGGPSTPEAQSTVADWAPPTGPFAAGAIIGADHANPFTLGAGYAIAWNHYTLACYAPAIPAFVATGGNPPEIQTHSGWRHVQLQGLSAAC